MGKELKIFGKIILDKSGLEKYSQDHSPYKIVPKLVVIPKKKADVIEVVKFAKERNISVTARAAGSNTCGSALGKEIVIDFSKMNSVKWVKGKRARVQPGVVYNDLNKKLERFGYCIPFNPSSKDFCTIGGNLATKASGLSSVKYGSIDKIVRAVEFVDSSGRLIDTSKKIPVDLKKKILKLREELLNDEESLNVLKKRKKLKTSSGYNLFALLDYKSPAKIITHLMSGSIGTLGLFTEIELEAVKKPKQTITCIAHFNSLKEAGKAIQKIIKLKPSVLEILDEFSVKFLENFSKTKMPKKAKAALIIEFDNSLSQSEKKLKTVLKKSNAIIFYCERDERKQSELKKTRELLFQEAHKADSKKKAISFVEDLTVPPKHLSSFIKELQTIFSKHKVEVIIYGHAGEGNLHTRPLIDVSKRNWKKKVKKIARECIEACFKYGGTITGEHGIGRNKSPFLEKEWGPKVYSYFKKVKKIFDPKDTLNSNAMFFRGDITKDMKY